MYTQIFLSVYTVSRNRHTTIVACLCVCVYVVTLPIREMLTFSGTVAVENKTCATSDVEHFLSLVFVTLPFPSSLISFFFPQCLSDHPSMRVFFLYFCQIKLPCMHFLYGVFKLFIKKILFNRKICLYEVQKGAESSCGWVFCCVWEIVCMLNKKLHIFKG